MTIFKEHRDVAGYMVSEQISLQCLVKYASSIECVATEDQSDDVFGPDARTVEERRACMARQLRQLAAMAAKLAEQIES